MKFNENQIKAIETVYGNVAVVATAGSGKTAVLTHRIKNMIENHGINPDEILAITFSRKARDNMQSRLEKLTPAASRVNIETFHSLAWKIIAHTYPGKYKLWQTEWEKEACIENICKDRAICNKGEVPFNAISTFIAWQKVNMRKPSGSKLVQTWSMPFPMKDMKTIYEAYEQYKSDKGYIEYDDFLNIVYDIFRTMPDIREYYQNKFHYILSDEYQDVSMNQALLVDYLGVWNNNFVVGDSLQSIYAFRGSRSDYLLNFDKGWEDVTVINLDINYRCSENIVKTSNRFAKCIPASSHHSYKPSIASNGPFKIPEYIHCVTAKDEGDEVSAKIKQVVAEGRKYSDIAILARTNAQLQKIATVLRSHYIPIEVVDGVIFTELPEVKIITSYLRLVKNNSDDEAFEHIYNKPNRWLDKKFLEEVKGNAAAKKRSLFYAMDSIDRREWRYKKGIEELQDVIAELRTRRFKNVSHMVDYLRKKLKIDEFVTKGRLEDDGICEQIDNLDTFQDICKDFKTIPDLLDYLDQLNNDMSKNMKQEKVKLLTAHRAKGLEFPCVFIIGCSDGLLPHEKNIDLNSEKNLMYVAITRAEKELYLSSIEYYNDKTLKVSPFIKELGDTIKTLPAFTKRAG